MKSQQLKPIIYNTVLVEYLKFKSRACRRMKNDLISKTVIAASFTNQEEKKCMQLTDGNI